MYELAVGDTTLPTDIAAMNLTCSRTVQVIVPSYAPRAFVVESPMRLRTEFIADPGSPRMPALSVRIAAASDAVSAIVTRRCCSEVSRFGSPPAAVAIRAAMTSTFDVDHARCDPTDPSTTTAIGFVSGAKAHELRVSPARLGRVMLGDWAVLGAAADETADAPVTLGSTGGTPTVGVDGDVGPGEGALAVQAAVPTSPPRPTMSSARRSRTGPVT